MSSSPWDDELGALRGQYLQDAASRLLAMSVLLDRLSASPRDLALLQDMLRLFHAFAGSGTTYGFPEVTALGLEGEHQCGEAVEEGGARAEDVAAWRVLMERLRQALAGHEIDSAGSSDVLPPGGPARLPQVLVATALPESRNVLRAALAHEGIETRDCETGADLRRAITERMPDALVLDAELADGSGAALVEELRRQPAAESLPVLILSPHSGLLDRVAAIHCGADAQFALPVDAAALVRRLKLLMERNHSEPARILSVEDDPVQAAFLRTVLGSAGYELRICTDPKHFEADLVSFHPSLLLMDVMLPGASGYDLVRSLRQDERYATLPVLFLTTHNQMEARIRSTQAGGDDHLVKPVAPALLLSTVAARIERARFVKSLLERDGLTGLLTHTALLSRARAAVSQKARRPGRTWAWVMIDLDYFKQVNDRFGHPAGDVVLSAAAALLRRRLRLPDTTGRYGGEEFAVLLEDLEQDDAVRLLNRLREEFASLPHRLPGGETVHATFSAGVAMLEPGMDLPAWQGAADRALYAAKHAGRNQVAVAPSATVEGA